MKFHVRLSFIPSPIFCIKEKMTQYLPHRPSHPSLSPLVLNSGLWIRPCRLSVLHSFLLLRTLPRLQVCSLHPLLFSAPRSLTIYPSRVAPAGRVLQVRLLSRALRIYRIRCQVLRSSERCKRKFPFKLPTIVFHTRSMALRPTFHLVVPSFRTPSTPHLFATIPGQI
jgi:hypothetical protein